METCHKSPPRFPVPIAVLLVAVLVGGMVSSVSAQEARSEPVAAGDPQQAPAARSGIDGAMELVMRLLEALGWWTVPFAVLSLVALWFTVERLVVLRRRRAIPRPFVQRFLKLLEEGELEPDEALLICQENGSPIAQIFAHGVRKWGKSSVEVEQAIIDGGERQVSALREHLRVLNGVATIAPLMGLLGTTWGMLMAFDKLGHGAQGSTERLSQDISLALVTTVAGLVIAIGSLCVYMYLAGRVDALVMEMDELSQRVVHCISAEALAERAARPRRTARTVEKPEAEPPAAKKKAV